MNTADHPEYPSGSACFCAAHGQASRRFLGSDQFGWSVPTPQGSSRIELWGGVHFMASIVEGAKQCRPVGDTAYEFLRKHIDGTAR